MRARSRIDARRTAGSVLGVLLALVLAAMSDGSKAEASETGTMTVSTSVVWRARLVAVDELDFGEYDPTDPAPVDAAGTMTVLATKGLSYKIYIDSNREMTGASETLGYELYSDAGRSKSWGATAGTAEAFTSGSNAPATVTVYGRIAALQSVQAGEYTDHVTITVDW